MHQNQAVGFERTLEGDIAQGEVTGAMHQNVHSFAGLYDRLAGIGGKRFDLNVLLNPLQWLASIVAWNQCNLVTFACCLDGCVQAVMKNKLSFLITFALQNVEKKEK